MRDQRLRDDLLEELARLPGPLFEQLLMQERLTDLVPGPGASRRERAVAVLQCFQDDLPRLGKRVRDLQAAPPSEDGDLPTLRIRVDEGSMFERFIADIYPCADVFVRELIQNSLDACTLRQPKERRRGRRYEGQILVTGFYEGDQLRAVRVDDNGIGMDVNEVENVLLWVGKTWTDRALVKQLILDDELQGRHLIGAFGVGILSCFMVSDRITIRTMKEGCRPIEFDMRSFKQEVKVRPSDDTTVGTTVLVEVTKPEGRRVEFESAVGHYCRRVEMHNVRMARMEWDEGAARETRHEFLQMAAGAARPVCPPEAPDRYEHATEILGDDFSGSLWFATDWRNAIDYSSAGAIEFLNEGIYVTQESSSDWLPPCLSFVHGRVNFGARAVTLTASRDSIKKDEKSQARKELLAERAIRLVGRLVDLTETGTEAQRDSAALALAKVYSNADASWRQTVLAHLDGYRAKCFRANTRVSLRSLAGAGPVYFQQPLGPYVEKLATLDGKDLYHYPDDFRDLQAEVLTQDGKTVLSLVRSAEAGRPSELSEAELISQYFSPKGVQLVDLRGTNVIGNRFDEGVPKIRVDQTVLGRFVRVPGLQRKKAWRVGDEVWINLANPDMGRFYEQARDHRDTQGVTRQFRTNIQVLIHLLAYRFEKAIEMLTDFPADG